MSRDALEARWQAELDALEARRQAEIDALEPLVGLRYLAARLWHFGFTTPEQVLAAPDEALRHRGPRLGTARLAALRLRTAHSEGGGESRSDSELRSAPFGAADSRAILARGGP